MLLIAFLTLAMPMPFPQERVVLQEGTATRSQAVNPLASPDFVYDQNFDRINAWSPWDGMQAIDEIACWETATDIGPGKIRFTMHFLDDQSGFGYHLLGRFRISVTTDNRSSFADGLDNNGDVTANWSILTNPIVILPPEMTYTQLSDYSILTGGTIPNGGVYVITYENSLQAVTGIRLEVMEHASLPFNGPGHARVNGNFLLNEMDVTYLPSEPRLQVANMIAGQIASVEVTGATPSSAVEIKYSFVGAGPEPNQTWTACNPLISGLSSPTPTLRILTTDLFGTAHFSAKVPAKLVGATVWIQVLDVGTCLLSNNLGAAL